MYIYFTDYFKISPEALDKYGAFNISLVSDLPLFIDPFLLFNSKKDEYQTLHEEIINYLKFLKKKSTTMEIDKGALKAWYSFKEVKQNWFGFSIGGNSGSGLGPGFAKALNENLSKIFKGFGEEEITKGSHLEKLCLIREGVGKDSISDFATNLIKGFLLEYTEEFTKKNVPEELTDEFRVQKAKFNYQTESWEEGKFVLPKHQNDFVLLTPKDLLTKDDTWINKTDLINDFDRIPDSVPDEQLRFQINNYFESQLANEPDEEPTKEETKKAAYSTLQEFPELIDFFIKYKEANGARAENLSSQKVKFSQEVYIENVRNFVNKLQRTEFYELPEENSFIEAKKKIRALKKFIESNDGYRLFYDNTGKAVKKESDLQLLFQLACHDSIFDINREPNNGRGPVDFTFSFGKKDKTLVEFKLASNTQLKRNLLKQVEIYQEANDTEMAFKVIIFFSEKEHARVKRILMEAELMEKQNIILIDGRNDNKPSASKA
ncbi:hypothetical protein HOD30_04865 [Candidatus Peregrinibacteria bacterium]|jgi:hypothetical protein|nr:hypothetical protein [Candidatus Peregrinibacteria bacterium]MBT4631732.1 hypothetical protein [Candidatus Peregrinibacteria bacterium]